MLDELAGDDAVVDYGYANDLGAMGNTDGYLAIECDDGSVVDEIYYVDVSEGATRSFDGSQSPDATANDSLGSWCDSTSAYGAGTDLGTPGAANDVCGGSADTCMDNGQPIAIVRPQPGDLVITEVLADADAVGDTEGEWFEFYAAADFHLNGLAMGKLVEDGVEEYVSALDCIPISAGSYVVMAHSLDPMVNGGVPAEVINWEFGFSLTNGDSGLWLGTDDEVLDAVTWTGSKAGAARQLDPDMFDVGLNDIPENWCNATMPYGAGDLGSPGLANEECAIVPPDGQCFDVDLDALRDIVPVEQGDLVITEHVANPEAVADADGEWFEVLVKGAGDLNGLEIG
ncbi:MAG: hypothetical protein KC431_00935, partial [Myxococcales bacterium]|nr:hypothetical protein [Myxococcales bacterium]